MILRPSSEGWTQYGDTGVGTGDGWMVSEEGISAPRHIGVNKRSPWTRQPPISALSGLTNPLGRVFATFGGVGVSRSGVAAVVPGPSGLATSTDGGASSYFDVGRVYFAQPGQIWVSVVSTTSTSGPHSLAGTVDNVTSYFEDFALNSASSEVRTLGSVEVGIRDHSGALRRGHTGNIGINDGRVHTIVWFYESRTSFRVFVDGTERALTYSFTGSIAPTAGALTEYPLWLHARNFRGAPQYRDDASQRQYLFARLSGTIHDAQRLSINPWQLFAPQERRIWVPKTDTQPAPSTRKYFAIKTPWKTFTNETETSSNARTIFIKPYIKSYFDNVYKDFYTTSNLNTTVFNGIPGYTGTARTIDTLIAWAGQSTVVNTTLVLVVTPTIDSAAISNVCGFVRTADEAGFVGIRSGNGTNKRWRFVSGTTVLEDTTDFVVGKTYTIVVSMVRKIAQPSLYSSNLYINGTNVASGDFNEGSYALSGSLYINSGNAGCIFHLAYATNETWPTGKCIEISKNPWQLFAPKRVNFIAPSLAATIAESIPEINFRPSADISKTGWTGTPDNTNLYLNISEAAASDDQYITSPILGADYQSSVFQLHSSPSAGTWTAGFRARKTSQVGQLRIALLTEGGTEIAVTGWQALTTNFALYELPLTTNSAAARVRIDVKG